MALREIEVSHEAIRDWEVKLLPNLARAAQTMSWESSRSRDQLVCWRDLTEGSRPVVLHLPGKRPGQKSDRRNAERDRDMQAAKAFLRSAHATMGVRPDRVTADGHGSYPRATRTLLGKTVRHRTSAHLKNRLEQDHRGIKGRIRCMLGFKSHDAAERSCREHSGLRNLLPPRRRRKQIASASLRRARFVKATCIALNVMQNA